MATLEQLEAGLQKAYAAGNMEYARVLGAELVRARGDKVSQIPGMPVPGTETPKPAPSLADQAIGAGETALAVGTGATGGALGMFGGTLMGLAEQILAGNFGTPQAAKAVERAAMEGAQKLTFAPRTPEGQRQTAAVGQVAANLIPVAPLAGEMAMIAQGAKAAGPAMAAAGGLAADATMQTAREAGRGAKALTQRVIGAETAPPARSVGAAGVPMEIVRTEKAQALPVPVDLTKGAAGREASQLAFEKEAMKNPELGAPLRARAEKNNLQALQNFDTLIDQTGAVSPDKITTGNALVRSLSEGYTAAKNKTNVAYKKARDSAEAQAPVNTGQVVRIGTGDNEVAASVLSFINDRPQGVSSVTDAARKYAVARGLATEQDGKLQPRTATVGQMEDFRRDLSGLAKFGDNSGLREETILKKLVDAQTEPVAGELYKKARALRTAQARKYENRAIVARLVNNKRGGDDPMVPVDEVFRRTVINGSPEELTFLKRVLTTQGNAGKNTWNELSAETFRHIRDEATKGMGMDSADNAIVSPAKLHQTVSTLDANGRLDIMLGKKNAQIVRDLNEVVRYVNTVPPGTLVNTSGTAGALMAAIAEAGATGALTGLPVPVISGLRLAVRGIKDAKLKARINKALGE